jgi:uncharacterized membrane protein (UPF0182 family)
MFGVYDPIFGRDIAFFVFQLPWLTFVRNMLLGAMIVALAGSVFIYLLPGRTSPGSGPINALREARRHLSVLAALVLLLLAAGAWLDAFALLLSSSGLIQGGTYADISARLPARR